MTSKIIIIAGEASGDFIGAQLIRALRIQHSDAIEFTGIGGPLMAQQGHRSLFDYSELSLMGLVEVLPSIRRLLVRMSETAAHVTTVNPDILITIDAPGFNFRLLKKLTQWSGPKVHYVAPQHWGWRPDRARKLSRLGLADILTLFPFEKDFFDDYQVSTHFVGHPVVEVVPKTVTETDWQTLSGLEPSRSLICVLPGSRGGELKRHLPVLSETVSRIHASSPETRFVWPTLPRLESRIREATSALPGAHVILSRREDRFAAFQQSDLALQASGTVALELAVCDLPMITFYKTHPLTWQLLKRMVRVSHANLVNLIADQPTIPEFLQDQVTPEALSNKALKLLRDPDERALQQQHFDKVLQALGKGQDQTPSERAAKRVLEIMANAR